MGPPIWVSPDASADELERLRRELEETLNRLTIEADAAALRNVQEAMDRDDEPRIRAEVQAFIRSHSEQQGEKQRPGPGKQQGNKSP